MAGDRARGALDDDAEYCSGSADVHVRSRLAGAARWHRVHHHREQAAPEGLTAPVFWHIDRFDSLDAARAAVGPAGIAFEAGGTSWLMTIESETSNHHGGRHVTHVGPLPLPKATKYAMVAQSAVFTPGMYSLVHHHSAVEAVYVVEGEACYETPHSCRQAACG